MKITLYRRIKYPYFFIQNKNLLSVADASSFDVKVPKCYVKEKAKLEPIHWALM